MDILTEALRLEWATYEIPNYFLYFLGLAIVIGFYFNWQKTLLIAWGGFYAWSMFTILKPDYIDLQADFNVLWVCGYGLLGFLVLGYCFYTNLK